MATQTDSVSGKKRTVAQDKGISERAYSLFLSRGGEHGRDLDDWLVAESEMQARSASATKPRVNGTGKKASSPQSRL